MTEYVAPTLDGGEFTSDINKRLSTDFGDWCVARETQSNVIDQLPGFQNLISRHGDSPEVLSKMAIDTIVAILNESYQSVEGNCEVVTYEDSRYDLTMSISVSDANGNVGSLTIALNIVDSKIVEINRLGDS